MRGIVYTGEGNAEVTDELDVRAPGPTEVLTLFGPQGERVHVRARSRGKWGRSG